jgi:hypothetical protein
MTQGRIGMQVWIAAALAGAIVAGAIGLDPGVRRAGAAEPLPADAGSTGEMEVRGRLDLPKDLAKVRQMAEEEARKDIAAGRYHILTYGLPLPGSSRTDALLEQRYGIEYQGVAGCIVDEGIMEWASAYNQISVAAIKKKFGGDVFERTRHDAWVEEQRELAEAAKRSKPGNGKGGAARKQH